MKKLILASIVTLTLIMSSCGYKEVTYSGIKNVELQKASLGEIKLKITVKVNNPNSYKITLLSGKFNIKSDDYDFGEFTMSDKTIIPANSSGDVVVFIDTELKNFFSSATMALMAKVQKGTIPVTIDGHINAKALFYKKKIVFHKTEEIVL